MQQKPSVLIVDDNPSLCKSMSLVLKRKGYAVTTAQNGSEAIERTKKQTFLMIFMDIKMPAMNGVETYRSIKKIRPEAPVMMMTAYSVEELVEQALQEGASGVLYKPLDIDEVVAVIERARQSQDGYLILVVDDDPGICVTLKNILSERGYKVGVAYTGEEALEMARENAYHLIFIDMMLPAMNGLETHLALKKLNPQATSIIITGYEQETADLVREALASSAYACLYKPFDIEELLRVVDEILAGREIAG